MLMTQIIAQQGAVTYCPKGSGSSCYMKSLQKMSWYKAQEVCFSQKSMIFCTNNQTKISFVGTEEDILQN